MLCSRSERCSHLSGVEALCQHTTDHWEHCCFTLYVGKCIAQEGKVLVMRHGGVVNSDRRRTDREKFTRQDTGEEFRCVICNNICYICG